MKCDDIPKIIELDFFDGDYEKYEEAVYEAYKKSFEEHEFYWEGKRIAHKKHPMYKEKPGTFWHIVSNGEEEEKRIPDLRRYERILWPAHILSYCRENCDKILSWKNVRKGKTRILLWCKEIDYLVVLEERKEFCIFWTAYPITYGHARKKLQKEYDEYQKQIK